MANFVVKRDGTKEPFDSEKIRQAVKAAAVRTGLAPEKVEEAVEKVLASVLALAAAKEEIPTSEIQAKVLAELDVVAPEVAASWREYDKLKGKE